jgi:hypothetical protein
MSIQFNTGVINVKGSPAIITDTFPNRPQATSLQMGTIYFSTDTFNIYQVVPFGSTQAWAVMGGGGGGSQNLDNVLYQGGLFTSDRLSNLNNYDWTLYNVNNFVIQFEDSKWDFNSSYLRWYNSTGQNNLFSVNTINGQILLGDFAGQFDSTHINIDISNNRIYFSPQGHTMAEFTNNYAIIGDAFLTFNNTKFIVNDNNREIFTSSDADVFGFMIQFATSEIIIGDFSGVSTGAKLYFGSDSSLTYSYFNEQIGFDIQPLNNVTYIGMLQVYNQNYDFRVNEMIFDSNEQFSVISTQVFEQYGLQIISDGLNYNTQRTTAIGDWAGIGNGVVMVLDDLNNYMSLICNHIYLGGNLTTTSANGNSGQHLKVTINSVDYVIRLENP